MFYPEFFVLINWLMSQACLILCETLHCPLPHLITPFTIAEEFLDIKSYNLHWDFVWFHD